MSLKCGIVGLPNVGKSTLFNSLTSSFQASSENYPFCTIDPNIGNISVPDKRLQILSKIASSQKTIPAKIQFVDIAGLVKGASKGEGLGNKFLSHIREVDAIVYILRCFNDADIVHVEKTVNPLRDLEIIKTELILSDIQSLEKRLINLKKKSKDEKEKLKMIDSIKDILGVLNENRSVHTIINKSNVKFIKSLNLLTAKPFFYVCNVSENELGEDNIFVKQVKEYCAKDNIHCVKISAKIEEEISNLDVNEEKKEFLKEIGLQKSGTDDLISTAYNLLNLITYFTVGPKETKAWTISKGLCAQKSAGLIHTDFEKGFICAEVIAYDDYLKYQGDYEARIMGKMRQEGKKYVVKDGDVIFFRFNVNKNIR